MSNYYEDGEVMSEGDYLKLKLEERKTCEMQWHSGYWTGFFIGITCALAGSAVGSVLIALFSR